VKKNILIRAMDVYDLPFDAPVELHVEDEESSKRYFALSRKAIKITI